jgi:hypothetical protein
MTIHEHLSAEEASRLAVTATCADLEFWARGVAVRGQVDLDDLIGFIEALREVSVPQYLVPARRFTEAAS